MPIEKLRRLYSAEDSVTEELRTSRALETSDADLSGLSHDQLDQVSQSVKGLPQGAQTDAFDLIGRTDGSALAFIEDTDDATLRTLLDDDALTEDSLVSASRRYADLDSAAARSTFIDLSDDSALQTSWIRATGAAGTSQDAVVTATERVRKLRSEGGEITGFEAASNINPETDPYYSAWYSNPRLGEAPSSITIDFETTSEIDLYRFYSSNDEGSQYGPWFTDADDIDRLIQSGGDVRDRYALPTGGKDRVAKLSVEPGTSLRASTVGGTAELDGGGLQYNIREPSLKKDATEMGESDYPGSWDDNEISIQELLNGDTDFQYAPPPLIHALAAR